MQHIVQVHQRQLMLMNFSDISGTATARVVEFCTQY